MAVCCASNLKRSAPNGHHYLQWAVTPARSLSRIFPKGRRALKAVKMTFALFSKSQLSQETGKRLKRNPGIISLGQF
jgi:hypothetical protein